MEEQSWHFGSGNNSCFSCHNAVVFPCLSGREIQVDFQLVGAGKFGYEPVRL